MEFFLNIAELSLNSVNSGNLINHSSMNWAQLKDPVSHMCLACTMVASWCLTQEVAGSSPFTDKCFLSLNLLNSVKTFRKNSIKAFCDKFGRSRFFVSKRVKSYLHDLYYRSGTVNSNTVNSKFHLIRSYHEIFF